MSSSQLYDTLGTTYSLTRRTDPRIVERIWSALGDAETILVDLDAAELGARLLVA